jgi:hypothetical protein
MKRDGISKKLRFHIFNRDLFTCFYCGACAPDAVLHIDHIVPVAKGGTSHHRNLVTSCSSCNLGKATSRVDDRHLNLPDEDVPADIFCPFEYSRGIDPQPPAQHYYPITPDQQVSLKSIEKAYWVAVRKQAFGKLARLEDAYRQHDLWVDLHEEDFDLLHPDWQP